VPIFGDKNKAGRFIEAGEDENNFCSGAGASGHDPIYLHKGCPVKQIWFR
jgi:hypothetical protein